MRKPEYFMVGEDYELVCQSRGSKPAAELTWYRGHVAVDADIVKVSSNHVTCSFQNPNLPPPSLRLANKTSRR